MPEGHAQFCERHIAACIVMTTFRGYSCIVWMQEWPPWCCQVHTCNVRGFSLSSNQCHQGLSPRNIAPHRNLSGLPAILRQRFIPDSRQYSTLRIASQFPVINTHTHKFCWKFFCHLASFLTAG